MFIKHNWVFLPTQERSKICKFTSTDRLYYGSDVKLEPHVAPTVCNQHIYVLSNEKPVNGDWFIFFGDNETSLHQYHSDVGYGIKTYTDFNEVNGGSLILTSSKCSNKVIATTDTELYSKQRIDGSTHINEPVPNLTMEFTNDLINHYNEYKITEILVEYNEATNQVPNGITINWLKVNKDHMINCKLIKMNYTRDEAIELCKKSLRLFGYECVSAAMLNSIIKEFIEENF